VAVIGWDGADWEVAGPLLDAGRLPHLAALMDRGAHGDLRSMTPTLSPLLWTTVATGRPPEVHGVLDFLEPSPDGGTPRPIGADARQVPALWEMAAVSGRRVGVVGWWATHPAEELPGFMISDRYAYTILERGAVHATSDAVLPPELAARLKPIPSDEVPPDLLGAAAGAPAGSPALHDLRRVVGAALSYQAALLQAIEAGQPDLLMAYFSLIDQVSHRFADCMPPALPSCPAEERGPFGGAVAAAYELQDRLLGELLAALDGETELVLLSDHGFLTGSRRPLHVAPDVTGKPGRWHRREGILVLAGPAVRPGTLPPADLLDVAPTVLALLQLPLARNLEGSPVAAALREVVPPPSIDSWRDRVSRRETAAARTSTPADRARIEELQALGYLSGAGARAVGGRSVAAEVNLASRLLQTDRPDEARAALVRALDRSPDYVPAWLALSEVEERLGRRDRSTAHLARAIELDGEEAADPAVFLRWAGAAAAGTGDPATTRALRAALAARPDSADLWAATGILRAGAGEGATAVEAFETALDLQPGHREALAGLFEETRAGAHPAGRMESRLREGLQARPESILARNWLALLLDGRGEVRAARDLLEEAAALAPEHAGTRVNLGVVLGRSGDVDGALAAFREALALDPRDIAATVGLGTTLARAGRLEEARDALEAGPAGDDPRLLNTLALVHRDLGDPARAAEALRASLAANPAQPAAREMLRALEAAP
jgi:tetratricopeptide (TPR) repeat protein